MKVKILKVKDGIIEPLGDDMPACMTGCGGGGGSNACIPPPPDPLCLTYPYCICPAPCGPLPC